MLLRLGTTSIHFCGQYKMATGFHRNPTDIPPVFHDRTGWSDRDISQKANAILGHCHNGFAMIFTLGAALIRCATTELRSRNTAKRMNNAATRNIGAGERQKSADNRCHHYCKNDLPNVTHCSPQRCYYSLSFSKKRMLGHTVIAIRRYNNQHDGPSSRKVDPY
jgi:hypothetical protein